MKALTLSNVRENNKKTIVHTVINYPNISRTELAKKSGISGGTITALVKELIEEGIILESKVDYQTGGRPKIGLKVESVASNNLIIEVKQREITFKTFDFYDNLLEEKTHKTNYLNGNNIVDLTISHIKSLKQNIYKVGFLIEENINANDITFMLSTGVSQSQISLENALKMYTDVEVIIDYSLKYYLEDCLDELALEGIELCAYVNFNDLLNTLIYNRNKQIELKDGIPLSINLFNVFEKIGLGNLRKYIDDITDLESNERLNSNFKKFVRLLGEAIMFMQIFYPLDAVFFVTEEKMNALDKGVWNYIKKQPGNNLKLIKNVVPVKRSVAKNMNRKLLITS